MAGIKPFTNNQPLRGIISEGDLTGIKMNIDEPLKINYHGIDVYAVGPNSQELLRSKRSTS